MTHCCHHASHTVSMAGLEPPRAPAQSCQPGARLRPRRPSQQGDSRAKGLCAASSVTRAQGTGAAIFNAPHPGRETNPSHALLIPIRGAARASGNSLLPEAAPAWMTSPLPGKALRPLLQPVHLPPASSRSLVVSTCHTFSTSDCQPGPPDKSHVYLVNSPSLG